MISYCRKCHGENTLRGRAFTVALTCRHCKNYYCVGNWNKDLVKFSDTTFNPAFPVGAKGRFDGKLYEVMGIVVKRDVKYKHQWREYLLFNPFLGYAFLSEYNGHWNFVWPTEDDTPGDVETDFNLDGYHYRLYQKYRAEVIYATGEFFFDVVTITERTRNNEYIAPPHLFGVEISDDSRMCFRGEYITPNEVAQAFNIAVNTLPPKTGMGYTEPLSTSFSERSLKYITIALILLAGIIQLFINATSQEKTVFRQTFHQTEMADQKFFKTKSFTLEGGTKSVVINLTAPVSNDWFFGEFSLINETDGAEYIFTKEIEYYSGYEDGSSWSEGSTQGEAFISQIPEGSYHINIYPEFSITNHEFSIDVVRDVPSNMNFFLTALALVIFPIGFYIRKGIKEKKRWADSDYSPYDN